MAVGWSDGLGSTTHKVVFGIVYGLNSCLRMENHVSKNVLQCMAFNF